MSASIETIQDFVTRKLKEAGRQRFAAIAEETGVKLSFIRKFMYGTRPNPRVETLQPLLTFFAAVDRGERALPMPAPGATCARCCAIAARKQAGSAHELEAV